MLAVAHMEMVDPPPLKSKENPNSGYDIDYDLVASITGDAFPCKGYLSLLGSAAGAPVATWEAGSTQSITIGGHAAHDGRSCQVSLSHDGGETFTVIHSYVGGCPEASESTFRFRVPADTPASDDAVMSWSWLNEIGNWEFYQNCAVVTITGGRECGEDVSFGQQPAMFTAKLGDGCSTAEDADVTFPDPGTDADINSSDAVPPIGNCVEPVSTASGDSTATADGPAAPRNEDWTNGELDSDDQKSWEGPSDRQLGAIVLGATIGAAIGDVLNMAGI